MVVGEPADGVDVLGDGIGEDHQLDTVVAQPRRELEGHGHGLRIDRCGGQRDLRGGYAHPMRRMTSHGSTLGAGRASLAAGGTEVVEVAQDDPLAQGPGADVEVGDPKQVHRGVGHQGAGEELMRPPGRDAGQARPFGSGHPGEDRAASP